MMPNKHAIYGFLFSLIYVALDPQIGSIGFLLIFLSSIFIDVDHYFASVISGRGWSLKKAYNWYLSENANKREYVFSWIIPFHSIEFFIIGFSMWYLASGWIQNVLFYILIGGLFHMFLDIIELIRRKKPIYLKLSFFYTSYINYRYLKYNIKPKHLNSGECSSI